MKRIIRLIQ